jgi:hypothetical protein
MGEITDHDAITGMELKIFSAPLLENDTGKENRRTPPSIPSKYEVPCTTSRAESCNAFGTRTDRFQTTVEVTPGPGAYYGSTGTLSTTSRSLRFHGYTSMSSKTPRFERCRNSDTPGPGAYVVSTTIAAPLGMMANTHCFAKPQHTKPNASHIPITPGPGQYDIQEIYTSTRTPSFFGTSAFMSTERSWITATSRVNQFFRASVGSYDVAKSMDMLQSYGREDRRGKPFPSAAFASGCQRNVGISSSTNPTTTITPGPGHYFPVTDTFTQLNNNHNNIRRTHAIVRVSLRQLPKPPHPGESNCNTPGPGWYFTQCDNIKSKGITSAFKSNLPRFPKNRMSTAPGPAYYRPKLIEKKDFLMNKAHRWV